MSYIKRNCDNCNKEYLADTRNLNRGWGLCCSKSCAAKKREKAKPSYNKETVARNNMKRNNWNGCSFNDEITEDRLGNYDPGDSEYWDHKDFG